MATALVTGGGGFIGSFLCEHLLSKGYYVICIDNFFTGSMNNILHLIKNPKFEVIRHDVTSEIHLEVDEIYNLACPASPKHYQYNPVKTIRTNAIGASNVLELAREVGAKVLHASTSEVYGDPAEHPQTETYWGHVNPIGLRSCYDEGKRVAETLMMDYHRHHGVDVRIARIFNTYGPRMAIHDGRVVSNFIVQSLKNENITVNGDGSQTRSFQYIDDLIKGFDKLMSINGFTGPVNLGNPNNEITILELANKIVEMTNSKSKIIFNGLPQDDPVKRKPSILLAKEKLNWEPVITLDQGLLETIKYFKQKLGRE